MERIIQSLPGLKATAITVVVCLGVSVLIMGIEPEALLGLAAAAFFLLALTIRNYDPAVFEAWHSPTAYSLRTERDELFLNLQAITEAVESGNQGDIAVRAAEARAALDSAAGRFESTAR